MYNKFGIFKKIVLFILFFVFSHNFANQVTADLSHMSGFHVKINNTISPYSVMGIFVNPSENVPITILDSTKDKKFSLITNDGSFVQTSTNQWIWKVPKDKKLCSLAIHDNTTGELMAINAFVMVPYNKMSKNKINKYRIGQYPNSKKSIYKRPRGFIEITKSNKNTLVAPHFSIKQFVCKQSKSYPKYVVLKEQLTVKLELILDEINHKGHYANSLYIMSGYRTPYYNQKIGNVKYSRHVWGDAADIFVDESPRDGIMDDLNKDGKSNFRDSLYLYKMIDQLSTHPTQDPFTGGLGKYKANKHHGPFVHVDTRGYKARW
jgi:hypothetical protein